MTARPAVWKLSLVAAGLGAALAVPTPMFGDGVEEPTPPPVSAAPRRGRSPATIRSSARRS
jgi:hypothetical protein